MSGNSWSIGIALVVGLLASACASAAPPAPSPTVNITPAPVPTPGVTPSPAATPSAAPTMVGLYRQTGKAGTFKTMFSDPQILLTLPDGWSLYFDETGGAYLNTGGGELLIGRPADVIDPETNQKAPASDDLMAWFVAHPDLNATDPEPVEISGHDAAYVDLDTTRRVDVLYDPLGNFHIGPGSGFRFYTIPWAGPDIFIALLRDESSDFDEALEVGVPVVESIEIVE